MMTVIEDKLLLRSGVEVAGRIALAPLTNTQSHEDGTLGDDELRWLTRRAEGGFPWINTCAAYISDDGKAWQGQLGIAHEAHLPGLTRLAGALREHGAIPFAQLHHGGAQAAFAPGRPITADDRGPDGPRAATEDDLRRVIDAFAAAARRAEQAGFAGAEIHGANGYLITQFLAPLDNTREDGWGGDLAGRARLMREAIQAARAATSPGFALGVRLNPTDLFAPRGITLADSLQTARWAAEDGVDWVHLSMHSAFTPTSEAEGAPTITRTFREALPAEVALLTVGGIWTREAAQRALDEGADVAVLGKAGMSHPDWPRASAQDGWTPITPPWTVEHLKSAALSEGFIRYISAFPGVIQGGASPRT